MLKNKPTYITDDVYRLGWKLIGMIGGTLVLMAYSTLVYLQMWTWFLVPLGVPAITYFHALGIDLFISLNILGVARERSVNKDMTEQWFSTYFWSITFFWGLAYLAHRFI